ncbi:molybdopterin-dependent oxidoreductase [Halobacterium salinarum]|uniref:molybdopterin-dependent oxidoreductase n=2 Tax=Halobacterium salinarum TaxID=2242 RepID=UPI0025570FBD|nr:molybdopterin-dependent oxidoreductase [Halobacterium salinarum]MDL0124757.1 molybdopterin-dependent oxidoreductase [Halobacterium salinarum]MDL0136062.1 molybdopterin-dependent oxidoreductase [Halobacterium salinarum]
MSDTDLNATRRDVLKSGAVAAVGLSGGGGLLSTLQEADDSDTAGDAVTSFLGEDQVVKTACSPNCRGKCTLRAFVRDGQIKKVQPNIPADERYKRGCLLGLSHTQRVYNSTRLKYPMQRSSWSLKDPQPTKRGNEAEFERISWDEALEKIAQKMTTIRDQYSPKSVYFETGSGDSGLSGPMQSQLSDLFGGTQKSWSIDINTGLGFRRVTGSGLFNAETNFGEDWQNANTVIVWGSDIFASNLQQDASILLDAIESGAKLVVVDPVYTGTASKADLWLPIRPGKDAHVAMSMIHTVLDQELYDSSFLRKRTLGPALVNENTGDLVKTADVFPDGDAETPVAIDAETNEPVPLLPETYGNYALFGRYTTNGVNTHTGLTALERKAAEYPAEAVAERAGLQATDIRTAVQWLATRGPGGIASGYGPDRYKYGHVFGQAYATLLSLTGDYGRHGTIHASHPSGSGYNPGDFFEVGDSAPGTTSLKQSDIITAMESGDPYQIKMMYSQASNFLANQMPNRKRWLDAADNLDLIAVADMHHTPTVQHADIVLPANHWFTREDIISGSNHPHVNYRQPVHEPLWEAKDDYWIIVQLAKRLGYGDEFVHDKTEAIKRIVANDDRIDYDRLVEQGTVHIDDDPVLYKGEFDTPTGRLEIYDEDAPTEDGDDIDGEVSLEVPDPIESRTDDDGDYRDEYPLMFMQKHSKWRIHSQYEYQPWVREINEQPQLDINPKTAKRRGIEDGDYVRVFNDRGQMIVRAKYNDAIRPEIVNTDQGWWERDYIKGHHNNLTHMDICNATGNFAFYDTAVEVEPAPEDLDTSKYTESNPRGSTPDSAGGE